MVKIEILEKEKKIAKIKETELERYLNFYEASYKDNLSHTTENKESHPRWSIISGYYSMHDVTKLAIAKLYRLKIEREVHATAIKVLRELLKDGEIIHLIEEGYEQFKNLATDLSDAKKERVKVQYFTGTEFIKEKYKEKAKNFQETIVQPYIKKIEDLLKKASEEKNDN